MAMFKTRITELLGIKYPIIGGAMMDLSLAPFVAAISNAGALGIVASAIFKEAARKMYNTGDLDAGTIFVSQEIGIPKKIMPVKDIVEEMIEQARAIHKRMASIGMAG